MFEKIEDTGIFTCYSGKNDILLQNIVKLYFKQNDKIADVTYGKGAFWKKVDLTKYNFIGSDLKDGIDFRCLPYEDKTFDIVILDPPYAHNPGNMLVNGTYNNKETTKGMYHKDIIQLYADGMKESKRILKRNGLLLVKCQDEIESSIQKWSHIEIYNIAVNVLNLYAKDLFILHQDKNPIVQFKNQQHARKNHSYMWIFQYK